MKPHVHAQNSAKRFGGKPEDYLEIHEFMDSSKAAFADVRHRALTHNSWFLVNVLPRVFPGLIRNSEGAEVSVRDIGEQHVLEDFGGFIPTAQDFLEQVEPKLWMDNGRGEPPPSHFKIFQVEGDKKNEGKKTRTKPGRSTKTSGHRRKPFTVD